MGEAITRHSLRPRCFEGESFTHNSGASRREIAGSCLNGFMFEDDTPSLRAQRSNQSFRAKKDWIASLRSQ
jgi:hypothetical protein